MPGTLLKGLVMAALFCVFFSVMAMAEEKPERMTPPLVAPEEAFAIVSKDAEQGDVRGMLTLGNLYERGLGTPRNYIKALEWYQKAADAGLAEGRYNLGVAYEIGMGNSGDLQKAVEQYQRAADMGLPVALQKMAMLYFAGSGVEKNESMGVEYMEKAAELGSPAAANELGLISLQGLAGQPKDVKKALTFFTRSVDMGNLEAAKNLAVLWKDGLGIQADPLRALTWYLIARKGGYQASDLDAIIEKLRQGLPPGQGEKAEADADKWIAAFRERFAQQLAGR